MPLDEIGRRYADSFYQRRLHEISPSQPQRISALQNQHASRGSIRSGGYIQEHYKLLLEDIDSLARAKLEGFLKAYEKSGLPFDEAAFYDVKQQIVDFCQSEQHQVIGSMNKTVGHFLGGTSFEPFAKEIVARIDAIIGRLVCDLEMKRDETILEDRRIKKAYAAGLGKRWDAFISHASEDKDYVRRLAEALQKSGLEIWFDETTLKVGDRLRESIDHGLAKSRFGIVVLSKHFFSVSKQWTREELEGLSTKEIGGVKVILPVWHNITHGEVAEHSPTLAGRLAARSQDGLERVVQQLREAMGTEPLKPSESLKPSGIELWLTRPSAQ